ncbi:MAG TPA: hypothetical protein VEC39_19940 [Vicinamibacterales bacterium]|nr:hypothetical protein [Vicinamibacterales bacterium]
MRDVLRGNFKAEQPVTVEDDKPTLESRFEREALKRLGGSIAFVSKKKFLFTGGEEPSPVKPPKND